MRKIAKLALAALSLAPIVAAVPVAAGPAPAISAAADRLAAGGYDVVAYHLQGRAVRGDTRHALVLEGVTWRFVSADHKNRFKTDPAAYAPQFGGYCAWAVSQGYLAPGDPRQWKIVDGKLYLNFNARAKALWEADQVDAIRRGHANWPQVLTVNQDSQ